jgi:erythritol kinase (D-erythritol 1-phosphate-forming)
MAPAVAKVPSPGSDQVAVCIDAGTTVIKAVVFDAAGRELVVTRRDTAVRRPARERTEQDMDEVWEAVVGAVVEAVQAADRPVRLLALTAQGDGAWLVDADGRPVRPGVLWNDGRAAGVVERWQADGVLDEAFRTNASLTNAGLPNAVLRALEVEEPEVVDRAAAVLTCGGWLFLQLTGVLGIDTSEASAPWLDIARGTYSDELVALYGLAHRRDLLPPLIADEDRVHPLAASAAERLGLPAGTPVVLAPYDIVATALGSGATDPGQAVCILGTTLCTETVVAAPDTTGEPSGLTLALGRPHRLLRAFPTLAGAGVVDWTATLLGLPDAHAVSDLAADAPPGADGLRVLPYLSPAGERAPFLDPAASGLFTGVTFGHGRPHVARAVLEGLAHVIRDCLEAAPERPAELRLCGGGAASALWCQVIADVTGVETVRTDDAQNGAKGALLTALSALGEQPGVSAAAGELVRERDRFVPARDVRDLHDGEHAEFLASRELAAQRWRHWRAAAGPAADAPGDATDAEPVRA